MRTNVFDATRQNHALEHATVSILVNRLGMAVRLAGRATPGGFYLYGDIPEETVSAAAEEALGRLSQGESDLAVSTLCGTIIAVAAVL
ncbi:MAG: hypothetical protein HY677_01550 [Chloroflexi bacterium]|nr:hypothetical protein [Chloroflexota bacterium]